MNGIQVYNGRPRLLGRPITLLQGINGKYIDSRTDIYFQIYKHLLGEMKKDTITNDSAFFLRI